VIVRAAIGNARKLGDQFLVIARVRAWVPCVARRLHARRATKGIHADSGVVGQRGKARARTRMTRFGNGILDECRVRLVAFRNPQLALRDHIDAERREQPPELPQFACVTRCEDQTVDHSSASTFFCAAINSRAPFSPSVTSASICEREKGMPSAVPWISTNRPEPVMTRFMSVSQPESSA